MSMEVKENGNYQVPLVFQYECDPSNPDEDLSGVSEPMSVRGSFQDGIYFNMPLMERVSLDTMVTVIDCSTYLTHLQDSATVTPQESPSLFYQGEDGHLFEEEDRQEEIELFGSNLHDNSQFSAVSDLLVQ